jgi:protein dithiol oxidoreductase (disulfide-forming)
MGRFVTALFCTLALALATGANAAQTWVEGTHYVLLSQPQHTSVAPGKVEVMEVFSYGCPACNGFQPTAERIKHDLPSNAQMTYLPAAFHAEEDWPMFQRAYFAAQALGIADRTHQAIYDAIWKTGELSVVDPMTHQFKRQQPTIEDAARSYQKLAGVTPEAFLAAAHSFSVDLKIKQADAQIMAMEVPGTPCIVVNGKYRVLMDSVGSYDQLIELVRYLVAKESGR